MKQTRAAESKNENWIELAKNRISVL